MLSYDPLPWLTSQQTLAAVRARRRLGLERCGDGKQIRSLVGELCGRQLRDGSFEHSPMETAGVLNLLADLEAPTSERLISAGAEYLFSVLRSQDGYARAGNVRPGSLRAPCDLCGFFGPESRRWEPEVLARNAREMNSYRRYEPLLGPKSPVRGVRRSSLDRAGLVLHVGPRSAVLHDRGAVPGRLRTR